MSVSFGPRWVFWAVMLGWIIYLDTPLGLLSFTPVSIALAAWYYLAKKTGRPMLTYGFGVDHMGSPHKTQQAFINDVRESVFGGDDEE